MSASEIGDNSRIDSHSNYQTGAIKLAHKNIVNNGPSNEGMSEDEGMGSQISQMGRPKDVDEYRIGRDMKSPNFF